LPELTEFFSERIAGIAGNFGIRFGSFDLLVISIFCCSTFLSVDLLSVDLLSFDILNFDLLSVDLLAVDLLSVDLLPWCRLFVP
jgi:hypothetical protein